MSALRRHGGAHETAVTGRARRQIRRGLYEQMVAVREGREWMYDGPADRERCHISGECRNNRRVPQ